MNNKLIVICGPTACGKTKIAAALASQLNGEIISADSRQVFRGMDIGTGKDLKDYVVNGKKVPYHCIDVASPMTPFNVSKYQKLAYKAINDVLRRGKIPFLVGGTGLYIDAVVKGYTLQNKVISQKERDDVRNKLDGKSLIQLLSQLKRIDPDTYNSIDQKNRRRVQRALEIYYETGSTKSDQAKQQKPPYDVLQIGINFPLEKIYHKIDSRLEARLQEGMIAEVKKLRRGGVTWKKLEEFGLEYRWVGRYLQNKITYDELLVGLKNDIHHFAKRQLTWFKRNSDIVWIANKTAALREVKTFLKRP